MVLWQQTIEITPELKKLKGHNYKGREIGPYYRLCNNCRDAKIEYKTYDRMLGAERRNEDCPKCNKNTKGTKGNFSKKCFTEDCSETILYKSKYSMLSGIKANTICQKCKNKFLFEKYTGKGFIGALKDRYEDGEERYKECINRRIKSQEEYWEKHPEEYKETKKKRRERSIEVLGGIVRSEEFKQKVKEGVANAYKERGEEIRVNQGNARRKWIANNPEKHERQLLNSQSKYKKHFNIGGLRCQGTSEKYYIEYLINNNIELPKRVRKGIRTSTGLYFPDFEYNDRYIEVKSSYTYQLLKDKRQQIFKIEETGRNIKPVEIIVIDNNNMIIKTELIQ